jgi:hypothetical protein
MNLGAKVAVAIAVIITIYYGRKKTSKKKDEKNE